MCDICFANFHSPFWFALLLGSDRAPSNVPWKNSATKQNRLDDSERQLLFVCLLLQCLREKEKTQLHLRENILFCNTNPFCINTTKTNALWQCGTCVCCYLLLTTVSIFWLFVKYLRLIRFDVNVCVFLCVLVFSSIFLFCFSLLHSLFFLCCMLSFLSRSYLSSFLVLMLFCFLGALYFFFMEHLFWYILNYFITVLDRVFVTISVCRFERRAKVLPRFSFYLFLFNGVR